MAQPDTEVAVQDAEDSAGAPGAEYLPVPGVVTQEADLGEHHGEKHGHCELPPRVACQDENRPSGSQCDGDYRDLPKEVPGAGLKEACLLDLPRKRGVVAATRQCGQRSCLV